MKLKLKIELSLAKTTSEDKRWYRLLFWRIESCRVWQKQFLSNTLACILCTYNHFSCLNSIKDSNLKISTSFSMLTYRVTQNKVHHLLAILYLTFEVNITQVSYVIECVIVNRVQFNEVWFLKGLFERNISNCTVIWQTTQFEISFKILQL